MDLGFLSEQGVFDRYADKNDNLGRAAKTKQPESFSTSEANEGQGPWVVEWCCMGDQKNKMHICTLDDHIRNNFNALIGRVDAKYIARWIILGIFRTIDEAQAFSNPFYGFTKDGQEIGLEPA